MKKIIFILPILLLFSCTVQKRKYQGGYYVDWHSKSTNKPIDQLANKSANNALKKNKQQEILVIKGDKKEEVVASNDNQLELPIYKKTINIFNKLPEDTCDIILFKDGSEIKGKVTEVLANEVKYKRCDTPDGPTYISRKSELFMIKYANGTKEVIKSDEPPRPTQKPTYDSQKYEKKARYQQVDPLAIVALIFGILSLVFGYAALIAISLTFGSGIGLFLLLPFLAALTAVISGRMSLRRIRENPELYKGKGLAMPGFIMGLVVLGIYAIIFTFALLFLFA